MTGPVARESARRNRASTDDEKPGRSLKPAENPPGASAKANVIEVTLGSCQLRELNAWAHDNGILARSEAAKRLIAEGMGKTSTLMRSS